MYCGDGAEIHPASLRAEWFLREVDRSDQVSDIEAVMSACGCVVVAKRWSDSR